ncbi:hypothetical protein [Archangium lipolyticum]|uniref:hypothetical protein n=1 Tax=Archangium lipolyticum TaxID=2970465 RepID=UPI00214A7028|nr:hypothetical protein [Archangium lipolyticum]
MAHPSLEELVQKFEAARKAGERERGNPEQLRLHRALADECPAFTHNLLYLAGLQPDPNVLLEEEIQTTKRYAAQEGLLPPKP